MSRLWSIIVFVIVWLMSFQSALELNGLSWQFIYYWSMGVFSHPEFPEVRDYGWRCSISLSFVAPDVWVGVLSSVIPSRR